MRTLIIAFLAFLMFGCASTTVDPIKVERRVAPIKVFHPPLPDQGTFNKVEWKILTPDIMREYLRAYDAGEAPSLVIYGLTARNYENLSGNMTEIKRLLRGYRGIIMYYRDVDISGK